MSHDDERRDEDCALCGLPLDGSPVTDPDVAGRFCCRGCLEVRRALAEDELDHAAVREVLEGASRPRRATDDAGGVAGSRAAATAWQRADEAPEPDGDSAFFAVEGMHCATCELFLERRASAIDGVHAAEASYATETLRVTYDGDVVEREELADGLSGLGYEVRDREVGAATDEADAGLASILVGGGLFGMMVMVWYAVFLYPTYLGFDPIVEFGTYDRLYVYGNLWLFSSFVLFYTGRPILRGAYVSLRAGLPNVDLLVAVAALGAYCYSTLAVVLGRSDLYFDVSVAIVLVVTVGSYYERRVKRRAASLLSELTEQRVSEARRADGEVVPVESVAAGDRLLVRPGERVPLDGVVREGTAAVDESLVTGEAVPVTRGPGDAVRGGTVVTDEPLVVAVGEAAESTLDRLVDLLWTIQSARPGVQRLADRLATVFVPLVLAIAAVATAWLLVTGTPPATALLLGLTVVIVTCPCALGLATPLAVAAGVQAAARRGIVVASAAVFEEAPAIETVVLDKTGTLTQGSMSVVGVHGDAPREVLRRAAAVERFSSHPIASAIVEHAREEGLAPAAAAIDASSGDGGRADSDAGTDATVPDGGATATVSADSVERFRNGVAATVDGQRVLVGHPDLLRDEAVEIPLRLAERIDHARSGGDVPVVVGWDGRARGVLTVGDVPREEWAAALDALADGRDVVVLTGDEGAAADRYRSIDEIDEVFVGVPPAGKAATVRALRARGPVAMVGDGSNDAPALAAADVGVALATGTELATDAADAVLVADDLEAVADAFAVAARTNRRIRQNLGWALTYNAVAIPLALSGLLNPLVAAIAMAASSALVVCNSVRDCR